ncbi:MAG: M16 family metallopeptidase [Candidatus Paceibacteria bacterium]
MHITHSKTQNEHYALVVKPETPLVMVHISADLGATTSIKDDVARSLLCDLLLSGAGKMTREEFLDAVNEAGGSIGVRMHEGRLTVTIETIESRLPKIITLTELMLTSPTFVPKEITRAKETYKKQLKLANEQARAMSQTYLVRCLYTQNDRVYRHTPLEEQAVVKDITQRLLRQLHKDFMNTYWTVTIGGNQSIAKRIQKIITKMHTSVKVSIKEKIFNSTPGVPKFVSHQITSQQNIEVSIGQRLSLTLDDVDYPAIVFALAVLGRWGGFSGRLMSTVREKEGLTYGIYARAEAAEREEFGHWRIMTFFHPKDLEHGIQSVLREVNKLHRSGITSGELTRFKTILKNSHILLFDSLTSLTSTVHAYHTKNLTFAEYESLLKRMDNLTRKEINGAIKKHLDPSKLSYSLAGNLTALSSQLKTLRTTLKL